MAPGVKMDVSGTERRIDPVRSRGLCRGGAVRTVFSFMAPEKPAGEGRGNSVGDHPPESGREKTIATGGGGTGNGSGVSSETVSQRPWTVSAMIKKIKTGSISAGVRLGLPL
jgi:hypothetical protein